MKNISGTPYLNVEHGNQSKVSSPFRDFSEGRGGGGGGVQTITPVDVKVIVVNIEGIFWQGETRLSSPTKRNSTKTCAKYKDN